MKNKLIYLLAVLIIVEIIFGVYYLNKKKSENKTSITPPQKLLIGGKMMFSPSTGDYQVNQEISIKILIDTKGKLLTGADSVIKYNPQEIEIIGQPTAGQIFPFYPIIKVQQEKGTIDITGTITDPSQPAFTGTGEFAVIIIKPLKSGKINLNFEYLPGKTNDSNLSEKDTSLDVLSEVTNATFNITP